MFFYTFLPKLLNMSLTASVAIVLVILLRLLLKKSPKVISYALWGVVLFRLLCPVSIASGFSFYNLLDAPTERTGPMTSVIEYVPSDIVHTEYPSVALPVPGVSDKVNQSLPRGGEQLAADPLEAPMAAATCLWMAGVLVMGIYSVVSYIRLRRKLTAALPLRENIFIADDIPSPFVMGLFRPKIYLPRGLGDQEQEYIILHERRHIRRLDHVFKALAFLALAVHWFNPLVWVAFVLSGKDMEMSCDEAVVREMGEDIRADYSASLLALATGRRFIAGTPLAFGEGDPKGRIKNLANWNKPAFWVIVLTVIVCAVAAVCLLTNPVSRQAFFIPSRPSPAGMSYTYEGEGFGGAFEIVVKEDGTFTYYEGLLSSYIGYGTWSVSDDVLTLTDETGAKRVNHFRIDWERLIFMEEDSGNFIYVKLEDGAVFRGVDTTARPKDGSSAILDYLGATEDAAALVADGLVTPNVSIMLDDTEITVTEMLYDDRFAYLAYEIELPEDLPEDAQPPWSATDFYLVTGNGEKIPSLNFYPVFSERSGQVARVVAEAHLGNTAMGNAFTAVLVLTRPEDTTAGDFRELRWGLARSPLSRTLEPNAEVREDGTVLTRLTVSPLSVYATLDGSEPIAGLTVNVFFRDGTMFDATNARVSSYNDLDFSEPGGSVVHGGEVGYPFGRIVDVSTIERVVVGEAEVFVE